MKIKKILRKWSKSRKIVIATLILIYPFGVYLMWKGEHFNPDMRWFISLLFIIATVIFKTTVSQNV